MIPGFEGLKGTVFDMYSANITRSGTSADLNMTELEMMKSDRHSKIAFLPGRIF